MSIYGVWQDCTISSGQSISSALDLDRDWDYINLIIPLMDECSLQLQVAERLGSTYYDYGADVTTDVETFNRADTWQLGGQRYIKIKASAVQSAARTIRVRGMRY